MIDLKLTNQAQRKSEIIEIIDSSWRNYVKNLEDAIFTIPFKGNYNALIEDNHMLIEGYCGLLLIDKVCFDHKTYLLKNHVKHDPFRIYGVYNNRGHFESFVSRPEIGFHYSGMSGQGHPICTGDIEYLSPGSFDSLKEISSRIINSFRLINMDSLGTVILPDNYARLKNIFSNQQEDAKAKFEKLLAEGLIEEIF